MKEESLTTTQRQGPRDGGEKHLRFSLLTRLDCLLSILHIAKISPFKRLSSEFMEDMIDLSHKGSDPWSQSVFLQTPTKNTWEV